MSSLPFPHDEDVSRATPIKSQVTGVENVIAVGIKEPVAVSHTSNLVPTRCIPVTNNRESTWLSPSKTAITTIESVISV